jgi:hypothetical protein
MDEPASSATANESPLPRRIGVLAIAVGALISAVAVMLLDWLRTASPTEAGPDSVIRGADLWEGKVTLGLALVALVFAAVATNGEGTVRRQVAAIALASAVIIVLLSAISTATAVDRERDRVRREEPLSGAVVRVEAGPWGALTGGLISTGGATLLLASTRHHDSS